MIYASSLDIYLDFVWTYCCSPKPVILDSYIWFVRYLNYFESLVTFLMNHSSQHLHPAFVFTIAMAICPALGSAAELTVVLFLHLMVGGWKFTYAGWNLLIVINMLKKLETFHFCQLCHISCTNEISLIISPIALDWHKPVVRLPSHLLVVFFPVLPMMEYQGSPRETLKQIDDMTAEWIQQVSYPTPSVDWKFNTCHDHTYTWSWILIACWGFWNAIHRCFRVQFLMKSGCVCFFRLRLDTSRIECLWVVLHNVPFVSDPIHFSQITRTKRLSLPMDAFFDGSSKTPTHLRGQQGRAWPLPSTWGHHPGQGREYYYKSMRPQQNEGLGKGFLDVIGYVHHTKIDRIDETIPSQEEDRRPLSLRYSASQPFPKW